MIRCGWGLERNRNGGNAALAVLALPTVGGKFGVRGGGYAMSNSASWGITRPWVTEPEPDTRLVNMNHLGRVLTEPVDPPVKMLFVYNCNPAVTIPDQQRVLKGLQREDLFTVVFEQVFTDSCLYADVVLPATTFLEGYDVARAYGPLSMQLGRPVVDPIGEARSNADVFGELSDRMGLLRDGEPRGELDLLVRVLGDLPPGIGAPVSRRAARRRSPGTACPCNSSTCSLKPPTARCTCSRTRWNARRRSGCTGISRIPPRWRTRWRSFRRRAIAPSARPSASCHDLQ